MSNRKVWFITGAGRGMGVEIAKAALAAGHAVVASGRDSGRVSKALGRSNDLLASSWTSPAAPMPRRPRGLLSSGSVGSTCWSTMLQASTRATSRS